MSIADTTPSGTDARAIVPLDRKAAARHALLDGPILPTLMRLALPTISVLVVQTLVGIAETYYVSFLGTDALVGVSVVFPISMLMTMVSAGGIGGGVASSVARAVGGGRGRDADALVLQAVALAVIFGLAFTLGVALFGDRLYAALGAHGQALDEATSYSAWLFLGAVPVWIVNLASAALRGSGNVRVPALITLFGAVLLVPLSPLFIFGIGPFHGFGVAGAGIAVTIYYALASLVLLVYLASGRAQVRLRPGRIAARLMADILKVGILSGLSALQLNLAVILVTAAVGRFGTAALAGYGMGSRLDYILIPILFGLGSAVLTMVGTAVGAGDLRRAKRIAFIGTMLGAGFTESVGLVVGLFPLLWLGLFTRDTAVLASGSHYLAAVAPVYGAVGTTFVLGFVSQGAARPLWPFLAGTLRLGISAGLGWVAVARFGVDLTGLSLIVALASLSSAAVCLAAVLAGSLWPRMPVVG